MDRRPDKRPDGFLKAAARAKRREIRVRQIHQMIDPGIQIHLHDGGIGIPKQGKIFELALFERVFRYPVQGMFGIGPPALFYIRRKAVGIFSRQPRKGFPHVFEAFQEPGRERAAFAVENHAERAALWDRLLVYPVGR